MTADHNVYQNIILPDKICKNMNNYQTVQKGMF